MVVVLEVLAIAMEGLDVALEGSGEGKGPFEKGGAAGVLAEAQGVAGGEGEAVAAGAADEDDLAAADEVLDVGVLVVGDGLGDADPGAGG